MVKTGQERREYIINKVKKSDKPVSAKILAQECNVSRQVIVQDIALLRAAGYDLLSTNRGYILHQSKTVSRIFKVFHTDEQMMEELFAIVDLGGAMVNVMVNHHVYGKMEAKMEINSRRKAEEFFNDINNGKSCPLNHITSGYHYHKIEADSEETLDLIEDLLRTKGFLIKEKG